MIVMDDIYSNVDVSSIVDNGNAQIVTAKNQMIEFVNHCYSEPVTPIATGWQDLNTLLGGGLFTGLYTIGGRTGAGKTTMMIQLCRNIIKNNPDTVAVYFGLETKSCEISGKNVAGHLFENCGIQKTFNDLRRGITLEQRNRINSRIVSSDEFDRFVFFSKESALNSVSQIDDTFKRIRAGFPGKRFIIIVDYLQIMEDENNSRDRRETIDRAIQNLSSMSSTYDIPVIVATSLNRYSYNGDDTKRLHNSSMKESGGIEYTSDVTMFLEPQIRLCGKRKTVRQDDVTDWDVSTGIVKDVHTMYFRLSIDKNRNGNRGAIPLKYATNYACIQYDDTACLKYNAVMDDYITMIKKDMGGNYARLEDEV